MTSKIAVAFVSLAAVVGHAAGPQWVSVDGNQPSVVLVDRAAAREVDGTRQVWVLRAYPEVVTLGVDAQSGQVLYPHRSAKIRYVVDCARGALAFDTWRLYSGNLGDGDLVWADSHYAKDVLTSPSSPEERAVLANACRADTAAR